MKIKPKFKAAILLALLTPFCATAGTIITSAKVIGVANTYSGDADFTVRIDNAVGVCADSAYITFPEAKKASDASFHQAFSIALTALTTGQNVRIHNFDNDNCDEASFILIGEG